MAKINVLQFICPTGVYGAEQWILTLINNLDPDEVRSEIAITHESPSHLGVIEQFRKTGQIINVLEMRSRFSLSVLQNLCRLIREREIDIIHTHGYKSDILGLMAAKKTGIKTISTPMDSECQSILDSNYIFYSGR